MNFHGGYFGSEALIDFSVNIPPLAYPNGLRELMINTFEKLRKYPEIDGGSSRMAIAQKTGFNFDEIILGNGATELIYLFSRSVGAKRALILEPTFTEYRRALELNDVAVESFSLLKYIVSNGNQLSVDINHSELCMEIVKSINDNDIDLLVICNPNNPTGHLYTREFVTNIINAVHRKDFKVFIDESFLDFVKDDERKKCNILRSDLKNIFLLRSMTKNFEVPGLRIGYGISNPSIIEKMKCYKEPWSLNAYALEAIPFLMDQDEHLITIREWCQTESDFLSKHLSKMSSISYFKGYANYLLLQIPEQIEESFFNEMVSKNIYLRKCEDFRGLGKQFYRIALRERQDNEKLIISIKEVLDEHVI